MNAFKTKVISVADKVTSSKAYKAIEKGAVIASGSALALAGTAISTFAAEIDNTAQNALAIEVKSAEILNNAQPFITPAMTVLCIVGGIKLGMRFLKSAMH